MRKSAFAYCLAVSQFALAASAYAAVAPGPSASSASGAETGGDESRASDNEIIVTAQKRSERLLDVPLSITAASGDQLTQKGISSAEQLEKVVPGFTFQKSSYGTPVFQIRGVGFYDTSVGASPTVSVYLDQVPLPYSSMTRGAAFDLERVEVLKGPQGTLFGQNSTGGAINYIAAKPTSVLKAGFDLDYGRFNEINVQGFVSGPLSDTLTARIAGRYEYRDPWQQGFAPNDAKYGKSAGDKTAGRRFYTGRFLLDWEPTDALSFEFNANGWQDHSENQASQYKGFSPTLPRSPFNAPVYAAFTPLPQVTPNDPRLAGWDAGRDYGRDDHFYQLSLRGDLALSDTIDLTSITAYSRYHEKSVVDIDGLAYSDFVATRTADIKSFSQEIRLSGDMESINWMIGGNYARDISDEAQINLLGSTNAQLGPFKFNSLGQANNQRVRTWAGFASLDFELTDQLTLQGSARYTKQDRLYHGCTLDSGNGQLAAAINAIFRLNAVAGGCVTQVAPPPAAPKIAPIVIKSLNQDNISWRASLNWKPNPDTLLYANVTKGYKAGSFTPLPATYAFQLDPVTQESVLAYEAGFKLAMLDNRLQLNGAGFYYDYANKQILGSARALNGNLPRLVNIPKSRVTGMEVDMTLTPVDGLRLSGGVTYVKSKVLRDPPTPFDPYGNLTSYVGSAFPNAPRWQGVGDAEYRFGIGGGSELFLGASVTARSKAEAVFNGNLPPQPDKPRLTIPGYALLDLRLGVEGPDGKWRAQIWGRNVTDKYYLLNNTHIVDTIVSLTGMPATYGISLSFRY